MRPTFTGKGFRLLILALLAMAVPALAGTELHVVMVSIDGLLPEHTRPGDNDRVYENLARLRERGAVARQARPVYPSLTYPGHASIVTGVHPARHGVIGNGIFAPPDLDGRGAWFASDLAAPALWDITYAAGMKAGAVSWPVSAGAQGLTWNFPEFWSSRFGAEAQLVRRHATPGLLEQLNQWLDGDFSDHLHPSDRRDALVAVTAAGLIREYRPRLLLVHFVESDKVQHRHGRNAPELEAAMTRIDRHLGLLLHAAEEAGLADRTVWMVFGDHGFADVEWSLGPNAWLARHGHIETDDEGDIVRWDAVVHATGNSAGVYLAKPDDDAMAARIIAALEAFSEDPEDGARRFRLIGREELRRVGGPARAEFYLEGEPGFTMSGSLHPAFMVRRSSLRGNHGGHPDDPAMATGFIIAGPGIAQGTIVDSIDLVDLGPTAAALLGLEFPDTDGVVREELFDRR